ncbi:MAG: exodeoxyribonuclease VII large subunit [bacterium]|nr:exodeoxyribonuclease VII large subunit [bacterium]
MLLDDQKIYTVAELSNFVNAELSEVMVRVRGEVCDFKRSQNGKFIYFDLKDEAARMNCFIMAFQLRTELEDGMEVLVTGSPGLYVPYGKYTFRVKSIEPVGEGALKRAFEIMRRKLEAEGLFLPERKKTLPRFPERIGLITSREAAAYSDFLRILNNRWGGIEISFMNVHVQGAKAEEEVVRAVQYFNDHMPVPDVLVVVRGGGSLEDLAAFNTESVARAIFASKIPVVVGVGHERDITLADLACDLRASTPSNAAEVVTPSREGVQFELDTWEVELGSLIQRHARLASERLGEAMRRLARPLLEKIEKGRMLSSRLQTAFSGRMEKYRQEIRRISDLLKTLNPRGILARGYSITRKNGRVIKDALELSAHEEVETLLAKGKFVSIVKE